MTNIKPQVTIFCDGGSQPNPGPGGWGALLIYDGGDSAGATPRKVELSGAHPDTTNNQMELTAACSALEALDGPHNVTMYVDSQYVKNGITKWIAGWIEKDWVTSSGDPVKNQALWERLDSAVKRHNITWRWVRGHAGNPNNERVDQLATAARVTLTGIPEAPREAKPAAVEAKNDIKLYVSGQFSWDVKAGGWGALVIDKDGTRRELGGSVKEEGVGNRVHLVAAIRALESLAETPGSIDVFTDQEYLQKGMSEWLDGWIKKGWRTAGGKEVKNQDLWEWLHDVAKTRDIVWHYVRPSDMNLQEASMIASRKIRW